MEENLSGGRNDIKKKNHKVYRPTSDSTPYIHDFLLFLHNNGFNQVPYPYAVSEDGHEVVSYIEGQVYNELLPDTVKSDETLISVCKLIKSFHQIGSMYSETLTGNEKWMLPKQEPIETMCHGDLGPYNITIVNEVASGIIDFDTLHPGPVMWELAYVLYRWIPLMAPENPESFGTEEDKKRRITLFMNTYGLGEIPYDQVINWVIKRIEYLVSFMEDEASRGNETFINHIKEGHLEGYKRDISYLCRLKKEK